MTNKQRQKHLETIKIYVEQLEKEIKELKAELLRSKK